MNMKLRLLLLGLTCAVGCMAQEKLIVVNEGLWQSDNGRLSYFEEGRMVSNEWFRQINGFKLGDTPSDIIQIDDNLIAIAVNWSNIVQFITPEGKAVAATEDVPNNRKLASDGKYVYVTSYGHEVTVNGSAVKFKKGFVAKIDLSTFRVVDAAEVGYEPEGIAFYDGKLFVANTGGYAFQENHEYESTVSVLDAETMREIRRVDTGQVNLYGKMSQSGRYLCINSPGDYYETPAASIVLDCQAVLAGEADDDCFVRLDYAATYSTVDPDGNFLAVGSRYSYYSGGYEFNYITIDPALCLDSQGEEGVMNQLPGKVREGLQSMSMPYGLYVNPYSGYIYATDAGEYTGAGALYQWSPEGDFIGKFKTYVNPAHFLALPPDGHYSSAVAGIDADIRREDGPLYNLQGMPVRNPLSGEIYIQNGKKIIF